VSPRSRSLSVDGSSEAASWPPRWLTPVPKIDIRRGDGTDYATFIEAVCRVTKDSVAAPAGKLLELRSWQRQLLGHLLARRLDGRYRHRQALIGVARKNGKSSLGAGIGLAGLVLGPRGGEVYSLAADREQARIVFGTARRMVELDPELSQLLKLYRDAIEYQQTGSVYRVLSAEAYTKEGLNPHLSIFDEVHAQPNRELWDTMALAQGARSEPLLVGITTAGVKTDTTGRDSLCYGMYQYGLRVASGEVRDPAFFMAWWEPDRPEADHRAEPTWRQANPGFADLVDPEDFVSSVRRTPENEYRTKRCNQWVSTAEAWLPTGAWPACEDHRPIPELAEVVLGFDGSFSNDSTALVAVQTGERPHVDVAACWERPVVAAEDWRVPILEVEQAIRQACRRWQVRHIVCDPFRWARTYQVLEGEGLPIVEFPQSPQRMVPATQRFYEAVINRALTHSGDQRLARHVGNCVIKTDARGSRLAKDAKSSPRKIDLAVAAVMAFELAATPAEQKRLPPFALLGR
jgi:phage terminase large subunit-like protein